MRKTKHTALLKKIIKPLITQGYEGEAWLYVI